MLDARFRSVRQREGTEQSEVPPRSGRGGRRFKSCHSDQYLAEIETLAGTDCGTVSLTAGVGERQPLSNSKLSDEQRQRLVVSERKD
jgi:hypothetical protein